MSLQSSIDKERVQGETAISGLIKTIS